MLSINSFLFTIWAKDLRKRQSHAAAIKREAESLTIEMIYFASINQLEKERTIFRIFDVFLTGKKRKSKRERQIDEHQFQLSPKQLART